MINIDLRGKVAVVTGGAKGIGSACGKILAQAGAKVVINYNSSSIAADELAHDIGDNAVTYKGNVANPVDMEDMIKYTVDKFSQIDILVNNAGTTSENILEDLTIEEIDRIFKTNIYGSFYTSKYALPYMKSKGGSIINISSTSMYSGAGGGAHYAASKSALLGLTRNIARDYGKYNIRSNSLAVTLVKTDLLMGRSHDLDSKISKVPLARLCEPEEIAYMVAFLSSDMGSYITGEVITIDGGRTYV